jgi:hypothetical protein
MLVVRILSLRGELATSAAAAEIGLAVITPPRLLA